MAYISMSSYRQEGKGPRKREVVEVLGGEKRKLLIEEKKKKTGETHLFNYLSIKSNKKWHRPRDTTGLFFQIRTKAEVLSQRNSEGRDILKSVQEIIIVTSEEQALQMLLKQYPSRHSGKWAFIQRILLQITKALTVPNSTFSSFVFALFYSCRYLSFFRARLLPIATAM